MLFAVQFEDEPAHGERRALNLQAHLDFLAGHTQTILVAGSLRTPGTSTALGGLWIVQAESAEQIVALYEQDPFWRAGLRKSVKVLTWTKAIPDRPTII